MDHIIWSIFRRANRRNGSGGTPFQRPYKISGNKTTMISGSLLNKRTINGKQTFFLSFSFCFEYFYFHSLSLNKLIVRNSYILFVFTAVYRNDDAPKRPVGDEMNHLMRHGSKLNIFNH